MSAVSPSDLVLRYGGNLPRYTSYPTAASFTDAVGPAQAEEWLRALPPDEAVSLYFHVPFCDELCRFCGCNTSVMRHEDGRIAYGDLLREELRRVVALVGPQRSVNHIQFGGGTPSTLPAASLRQVLRSVRQFFKVEPGVELAMELDPRHVPAGYPDLLGDLGFTRISLGVQDLEEKVQEACGRHQSFAQTEACINVVRAAGVTGVNVDLIYGLPYQTEESVAATARKIASLRPDRLAVFGYAHVPWKQKRQRLIPEDSLPQPAERLRQRTRMEDVLCAEGYLPIGLDHYALPGDPLARAAQNGTLRRNFQGYTTDSSAVLLGVGASAISMLPDGYTQNITTVASYVRALADQTGLPVARGVARTAEDKLRGRIIEDLMCTMQVDLQAAHGEGHNFLTEYAALRPFVQDGFVQLDGSCVRVTEAGRPVLRNVAAVFDTHRQSLSSAMPGAASQPRFATAL
ncbi:oxygen-independent coproporphyrinogen III oxidase [Acetobacter orleanensis]|uniref:Coproporphyrinogen-III oxidase n=1 Tax=Acetobacter orleanensis TaxID=104099 RepID=A0A4Y3TQ79_9PROT|nr:oxygen-independent coproporphyrinogen III oxidase [Acetobacter orleanensis]KXV66794.1 coproporphyrinogen III oxidase [Acetobacter orleanensis]PCD79508.1 oxygen-independent coproporphyrinogen III oxidase [Acetobacter orleanensis]GAN69466.1 coproporphyrinogen III oxidase [Acetobacter orleanensis JCM 7639]GBR25946.1 coproporphyrinogen III oxidase [Acetobacter orleanensis NRIC 0473]GEB83942.1 coproporphyrinogen-III oxidase [Acetobacter orleanensis]